MTADAGRAAFEAWASHPERHGKLPIEAHANGAYKDQRTYTAYYGWWASRKQALAEAAQACSNTCTPNLNSYGDGYNQGAIDCETSIKELK